jgi:hypothetical protein
LQESTQINESNETTTFESYVNETISFSSKQQEDDDIDIPTSFSSMLNLDETTISNVETSSLISNDETTVSSLILETNSNDLSTTKIETITNRANMLMSTIDSDSGSGDIDDTTFSFQETTTDEVSLITSSGNSFFFLFL